MLYPYVVFVYDFLSMKNDKEDGKLEFTGEKVVFRFEHVSFKYKGSKHYSIKDISLTIDDNDRVALVGENGAGKSTFLKLLMLVHYPTEGTIYLNDIPLDQYSKASLYNANRSNYSRLFSVFCVASKTEHFGLRS